MKKVIKRIGIIIIGLAIIGGALIFAMFLMMNQKTEKALAKQINADIDMSKVKDGVYEGSSDGGMVQVEVQVEVKDSQIIDIKLIKHDNGKGKPAEAMIDDMITQNTDNVDAVSGATTSSRTIRNAVNVALQKGME